MLPGLIDNHLHIIRGGLNFNMELRWDGAFAQRRHEHVEAGGDHAAAAMGTRRWRLYRAPVRQRRRTARLNAAAPDTPVFLLHLSPRDLSGSLPSLPGGTPEPPGGGTAIDRLVAGKPNANILRDAGRVRTVRLPGQLSRHFMRE